MISTNRLWSARPFLIAYVVVIGFTVGLLVSRDPLPIHASVPALSPAAPSHGASLEPPEAADPPLWLQLLRPGPPLARTMLRMALPVLTLADGSAREAERREFLVYWTGHAGDRPQTLFQTVLPFLRPEPPPTAQRQPDPGGSVPPVAPRESGTGEGAGGQSPPPLSPRPGNAEPPQPLALGGGLPLVGIYHTHDWESFLSEFPLLSLQRREDLNQIKSENHKLRTIMGVGMRLSEQLQQHGVASVWAKATHQQLGYDYAYRASRTTARQILREWPSVTILLDLHRDAAWGLESTATIDGERIAQIRCIIGSQQPRWEQNRAFCELLMEYVEKKYPGLTLPTRVQPDIYNQDLMPGAILLEIGNATNEYAEAERAVVRLAEALADLIRDDRHPR